MPEFGLAEDGTGMTLALLGNTLLRTAITRNLVSFPAQIQPFMKRNSGDLQERIVQLYFVRGWSVRNICARYGLSKAMAHKLLAEWRIRAVESGYIQEIEPGNLAVLEQVQEAGSNGMHSDAAVHVAAAPAPATRYLPEFTFVNTADTRPVNPMPAPTVENPAALSAGSGA
jgi:transposase-like protein